MNDDLTNSYHGTDHDKIDTLSNIPPIPESFQVPNAPAIESTADCEPRYSKVFFHGNYGMLCGQYQEFTRYDITESQIRQIGWAAFGNCGWNADRCA
jgi:hypothetical protein